jgi:protein-S-isoprenylcysteine O-methyltransferase Ste14
MGSLTAIFVIPSSLGWTPGYFLTAASLIGVTVGAILIICAFFALGRNFSLSPQPKASSVLVTKGIYSFVRHPLHSGLLLILAGICLDRASFSHLLAGISAGLVTIVLVNVEEAYLRKKFAYYSFYAGKTGKFFPRLTRVS